MEHIRAPEEKEEIREPLFENPNAPVTLLWFLDLESPFSKQALALVKDLATEYPGKVKVILEHAPLLQLRPQNEEVHVLLANR